MAKREPLPELDLMRSTMPLDGDEADQSRGDYQPSRRRGRPPAKAKKIAAHKLSIPAPVFLRLTLESLKSGRSMSAIAGEILDAGLPRHRISTDQRAQATSAAD